MVAVAGAHRQETRSALNEVIERVKYELDFQKEEETNQGNRIIMSEGNMKSIRDSVHGDLQLDEFN